MDGLSGAMDEENEVYVGIEKGLFIGQSVEAIIILQYLQ